MANRTTVYCMIPSKNRKTAAIIVNSSGRNKIEIKVSVVPTIPNSCDPFGCVYIKLPVAKIGNGKNWDCVRFTT